MVRLECLSIQYMPINNLHTHLGRPSQVSLRWAHAIASRVKIALTRSCSETGCGEPTCKQMMHCCYSYFLSGNLAHT